MHPRPDHEVFADAVERIGLSSAPLRPGNAGASIEGELALKRQRRFAEVRLPSTGGRPGSLKAS